MTSRTGESPTAARRVIYETRITRELGEMFGASDGREREISTGLFVSILRDTSEGSLTANGPNGTQADDVRQEQPHAGPRPRRRVAASHVSLSTHGSPDVFGVPSPSPMGIPSPSPMGHSAGEVSLTECGTSTSSVRDVCFLLRDLTSTPNLVVSWCSETESFKVTSSNTEVPTITSPGVRLLLRFTQQYFISWGVVIPDELLNTHSKPSDSTSSEVPPVSTSPNFPVPPSSGLSPISGSRSVQPKSNAPINDSRAQTAFAGTSPPEPTALDPTSSNVCVAIIEIPSDYPMAPPCVGIVHLAIQQHMDWYHSRFSRAQFRRHFLSSLSPARPPEPCLVRDALPLTQLNPNLLSRLVLGESWTPAISLDALIVRLSAFLREQAIAHVYHTDAHPPHGQRYQQEYTADENYQQRSEDAGPTITWEDRDRGNRHNNSRTQSQPQQSDASEVTESADTMQTHPKPLCQSRPNPQFSFLSLWTVLLISVALRIVIGNQPHSGQYNAPVYGDYEVHRHWKELTINRPINQWYVQEDQYWNLDYPPLMAFHEWVMGKISQWLDPNSVTDTAGSRGYLTLSHKLFMRWSVIISDLLVFHTAAIFFWCFLPDEYLSGRSINYTPPRWGALLPSLSPSSPTRAPRLLCLLLFLCSPPIVMVDHAHFQYNCVALGLVLWAINFMALGNISLSVCMYLCAVLYKQTMLYFVPAFAVFYLGFISRKVDYHGWLSRSIRQLPVHIIASRLAYLVGVAISVVLVILSPFILGSPLPVVPSSATERLLTLLRLDAAVPILRRIFPLHRGIYEDYVASVWIALRPVIKMNQLALTSRSTAFLLCTGLALFFCIPACIALIKQPTFTRCRYSLICCSLSFYLWSPQVHEKAILLPLTIALLSLPFQFDFSMMFGFIASFSLLHLMIKDFVVPAFVGLLIIWTVAAIAFRPTIKAWDRQPPLMTTQDFNKLHVCSFAALRDAFVDPLVFLGRLFNASVFFYEDLILTAISKFFGVSSKPQAKFSALFPRPVWDRASVQCAIILSATFLATFQAFIPPPARYLWLHVYLQCVFCCVLFILLGITSFNFMVSSKIIDSRGLSCTKVLLLGPAMTNNNKIE